MYCILLLSLTVSLLSFAAYSRDNCIHIVVVHVLLLCDSDEFLELSLLDFVLWFKVKGTSDGVF